MKPLASVLLGLALLLASPSGPAMAQDHDAEHGRHGTASMGAGTADHAGVGHAGHGQDGGMEDAPAAHHDHEKMMAEAAPTETELAARVTVKERLGDYIDFSARFVDSRNRPVDLETVFDKPVVLLPVYFMCTSVCNFLQAELANVLNHTDTIPGKDFNVVSLSFSDDEDASHARTSKRNYANLVKKEMDTDHWYYLTGDRENILKATDSLGYYFVKSKKNFYIHPNALVVLAPDGKIIRYLYGPDFLPFDVEMALSEARKGEPGISIKRGVLSFCFDYDPENKTYVFKMFRITGTAILIILAGFVLFLIRPSKSGRKRGLHSSREPPGD